MATHLGMMGVLQEALTNFGPTFVCASAKTSLHPHTTLMVNRCAVGDETAT